MSDELQKVIKWFLSKKEMSPKNYKNVILCSILDNYVRK